MRAGPHHASSPVCPALCRTEDVEAARAWANTALGHAEYSPNYQRLLEHGDASDVGDLLAAGDEGAVLERLTRFRDAGVTDLAVRVLPFGTDRDERIASKQRTQLVLRRGFALAGDQFVQSVSSLKNVCWH